MPLKIEPTLISPPQITIWMRGWGGARAAPTAPHARPAACLPARPPTYPPTRAAAWPIGCLAARRPSDAHMHIVRGESPTLNYCFTRGHAPVNHELLKRGGPQDLSTATRFADADVHRPNGQTSQRTYRPTGRPFGPLTDRLADAPATQTTGPQQRLLSGLLAERALTV